VPTYTRSASRGHWSRRGRLGEPSAAIADSVAGVSLPWGRYSYG